MAETALKKSRDVKELKKFRSALKGQITSAVSKLEALFARKVEDDFDQGDIFMSEVNQVEAKTYSSSATVATKTKISPSNIGGQDGAKMEGPRCQVLKLLHGAEVGYTNVVKKSLPSVEMEDGDKDENECPKSKTESKLSENIQPVSRTELKITETEKDNVTSTTYSSNIKIKNSSSSIKMENLIERRGNLETLIRSSAYIPCLMGRRPLVSGVKEVPEFWRFLINYDDAWRRLDLKKTQNILSSNKKGDKEKIEKIKMKEMKPYLGGYSILLHSKALLHDSGGSVLPIKMIRTLLPSEDFTKVPVKAVTSQKNGSGVTKMRSQ